MHLVAVDGELLGTCRMLIEPGGTAKFGRLCVRASARRRGIAAALLAAAEDEARAAGARRIGMHAQTDALGLYRRAGYTAYGERFDEEGIEHLGMEKLLR
jgi:ElaA protein